MLLSAFGHAGFIHRELFQLSVHVFLCLCSVRIRLLSLFLVVRNTVSCCNNKRIVSVICDTEDSKYSLWVMKAVLCIREVIYNKCIYRGNLWVLSGGNRFLRQFTCAEHLHVQPCVNSYRARYISHAWCRIFHIISILLLQYNIHNSIE